MSKLLLLSKTLLKTSFNSLFGSGKKTKTSLILFAIVAVSLAPILFGVVEFLSFGYDVLSEIQQEGLLLSLGLIISGFIIFFFGIFYVIGTFYLSGDIENLLPLPLKPYQIIAAKFNVVLVYEYLMELFFLVPIIVIFGIKSSAGIVYYIYSLIVFLTLPIIPLALASIIVMIIMRFINIGKNKDMFKLVGSLIAIALAVGINVLIQNLATGSLDIEALAEFLMEGNNSLMRIINGLFPGLSFGADALVNAEHLTGLYNLAIYLVITFGLFSVFLMISEFLYFKGVLGISETDSKKKELTKEEMDRNTMKGSVIVTYAINEFRILIRTPAYLLNCVITNFIWPIFALIPIFSGGTEGLPEIGNMIRESQSQPLVIAAGFAVVMFISSSNAIAATAISREGENYYTNKYIPVSYSKQIIAKIIPAIFLSTLGALMGLILAVAVFGLPVGLAITILLIGLLAVVFSSLVGITLDLFNPKLTWDNEQKAVKQNLNVVFHIIIGIMFAGLTVFTVYKLRLSIATTIILILVFFGAATSLLYKLLTTKGIDVYNELGE